MTLIKYYCYTTDDVIGWWSDLERRGRHDLLAVEAYWLPRRRWDGIGMVVDVGALEEWMEAYRQRRLAARLVDSAGTGILWSAWPAARQCSSCDAEATPGRR